MAEKASGPNLPLDPFDHGRTDAGAAAQYALGHASQLSPQILASVFGTYGLAPTHVEDKLSDAQGHLNRMEAAARRHSANIANARTTEERSAAQAAQRAFIENFGQ